jgi:heme o synthase
LIFMWTPPHFWALALFREGDYEKAGVPMLPNVAGRDETRRQILIYSLLLVPTIALPLATGTAGTLYAAGAVLLTAKFLYDAVALYRAEGRAAEDQKSKKLFGFSIIWLFAIFALILVERLFHLPAFAPVFG